MKKNTDLVIGLQWGDEGKGKIVDLLLSKNKYDIVIRANGGNNAGHSIKVGDNEFAVHSLPSGMLQDTVNIIGPGCVVNPEAIIEEIKSLGSFLKGTLIISDKCPLILRKHIEEDKAQEILKGVNSIGTTLKGIGPAYADLKNRTAVFAGDLNNIEKAMLKFQYLNEKEISQLREELTSYKALIGKYVESISYRIRRAKKILIEGAQATMLDNLYGTYPYVTSSSTIVSGLLMGSGLNHSNVNKVYGVTKMYSTRVGNGPFITEMDKLTAKKVRHIGKEVGVSTGRERRCGWIDLVQLNEAILLNGVTDLCLIKSDVLDSFKSIKICTNYITENKDMLDYIPYDQDNLMPLYQIVNGWEANTYGKIFTRESMPKRLLEIITYIEYKLSTKVTYLSTGPERNQTMVL